MEISVFGGIDIHLELLGRIFLKGLDGNPEVLLGREAIVRGVKTYTGMGKRGLSAPKAGL